MQPNLATTESQPPPDETPRQQPRQKAFPRLFPNPTGANGYEDLVQAVDLLDASPAFREFDLASSPPTLAETAQCLADPDIKRSLELIRTGLGKPVVSPYGVIDTNTAFPEMSGIRRISRLLPCVIVQEFAFGRFSSALDWIDSTIRFAYAIQQKVRIAGVVGIACDALLLARCVERIEPLSRHDCTHLLQLLENRLRLPNAYSGILRNEYDYMKRTLVKGRDNADLLAQALNETESDSPSERAIADTLRNDPDLAKRASIEAISRLTPIYEQGIADALNPPHKRRPNDLNSEISAEAKYLLAIILPPMDRTQSRFDQIEAQYRIFATRLLLRRYRWENDRYPESLAVFKEKSLIEDPFSGKPLAYTLKGSRYELSSIGDFLFDDNGKPTRERTPVLLPRPYTP